MNAGELKYPISILRQVTEKTEFGNTKKTWTKFIETRAKIIHATGDKSLIMNELYNNYKKTFIIRIYHTVDEKCRLQWKNDLYQIISIDPNEDQQYMTLVCEKVNE